ncbi:zinc carboxypeptidase [Anabrus simplex]|uniref:zinc carboxypeptidase n=1 Tax=Anabrus simplex TaxID=316456 RepID=UPI0035A37BC0
MVALYLLMVILPVVMGAGKARFDNYQVIRVVPQTLRQVDLLRHLSDTNHDLSFWTGPTRANASVDIMVPPHKLPEFEDILQRFNFKNEVYIEDVQKVIDQEQGATPRSGFGWTNYYRLQNIYDWLDSLVKQYPGIVTSIVGGKSYEGRQIKGVKVSYKSGNKGVFVEAGIHAREWISPATVTYILNQLLTSKNASIRDIAENYDWYIFPSTNPDGYEYTHTTNRMWRKTRSRGLLCVGADPNRNWGFHWMDGGASSNECSETYAGSKAFSEIETKSLSEYITSIADKIQVYLAFHSYSQLLLIPYGHSTEHISNYDTLMSIGTKAKAALAKRYGTQYTLGNIAETIYVASGGSMDWVRGTFNTPITYTYELRDTGRYGFTLPASQIIPTGEETLDSVLTILQEARKVIR